MNPVLLRSVCSFPYYNLARSAQRSTSASLFQRTMLQMRHAASFPIIQDPKAIKIAFKEKIDASSWKLDTPLEPKEKKTIAANILKHNPSTSISELFHKKPWSVEVFNEKHLPTVLGPLKDCEAFSQRYDGRYFLFMDMPIRLAGKGWMIPKELLPYREIIERAARFERLINPKFDEYNVYLTVDQRQVKPGESQRRTGWHADSYINVETRLEAREKKPIIETDSIYLASDCIPTEFCAGPFPFGDLDPNDTEKVLHYFEGIARGKTVVTYPNYTLVRIGPECIHQVGINKEKIEIPRTFVKITFSRQILNREGNGINQLFDVNWPMVPRRADKRNHSTIIGFDIDPNQFRQVDRNELFTLFATCEQYAQKIAKISAYLATPGELLQTRHDGFTTTANIAKPGDWKVTSPGGDQYFLSSETMDRLYKASRSKGTFVPKPSRVAYVQIKENIQIMAPWGTIQYLREGDYLVQRDEGVYGILQADFEKGFKKI